MRSPTAILVRAAIEDRPAQGLGAKSKEDKDLRQKGGFGGGVLVNHFF
jgi:hypothetical protein